MSPSRGSVSNCVSIKHVECTLPEQTRLDSIVVCEMRGLKQPWRTSPLTPERKNGERAAGTGRPTRSFARLLP